VLPGGDGAAESGGERRTFRFRQHVADGAQREIDGAKRTDQPGRRYLATRVPAVADIVDDVWCEQSEPVVMP